MSLISFFSFFWLLHIGGHQTFNKKVPRMNTSFGIASLFGFLYATNLLNSMKNLLLCSEELHIQVAKDRPPSWRYSYSNNFYD